MVVKKCLDVTGINKYTDIIKINIFIGIHEGYSGIVMVLLVIKTKTCIQSLFASNEVKEVT